MAYFAWKKIFRSPPSAPLRLSFCASVQVSRDSFPDPRVRRSLVEQKYQPIEGCEQSSSSSSHSKFCTCDLASLPDIIVFVYEPGQTNVSRNFIDFNKLRFPWKLAYLGLGTISDGFFSVCGLTRARERLIVVGKINYHRKRALSQYSDVKR